MYFMLALVVVFSVADCGKVADIAKAYDEYYWPCACKLWTNDFERANSSCTVTATSRSAEGKPLSQERMIVERAEQGLCPTDAQNPDANYCFHDQDKLKSYIDCESSVAELYWGWFDPSFFQNQLNNIIQQKVACYKALGGQEQCFLDFPKF